MFIACTLILPGASFAQQFPTKPIRLVVGFVPGGTTDTTARILAQKMTESFGHQVIVDNRPGAASNIAAEHVVKSPPDGYTLLVITVSQTVNASLYKNLNFDIRTDLAGISQLVTAPHVLVVHPSLPVKSTSELIALAKKRPGQLNFANAGSGSTAHLAAALFSLSAGLDITHIPYKGAAAAMTDLLSGQTHAMFSDMVVGKPHMVAGKLRPLAISLPSGKRSGLMPELPTVSDTGLPGFESGTWVGVAAPGGTPRPIVDRLNAEAVKGFNARDTKDKMTALGLEVVAGSPDALNATIRADVEKWGRIVKQTGLTPN